MENSELKPRKTDSLRFPSFPRTPSFRPRPHHIVLYCGTNDLAWRTPEEIATNITGLVKEIKGNNIECSVSAVLKRSDELRHKVIKVNKLLKTALVELDVQFIEHDNINEYHLNKSGLHLDARGDAALARNLIQFIKNLEVRHADPTVYLIRKNHVSQMHLKIVMQMHRLKRT